MARAARLSRVPVPWWAALLALLLLAPARADTPERYLLFQTDPPGARPFLAGKALPETDRGYRLDLREVQDPLRLTLVATHYEPREVEVPLALLRGPGPHRLPPEPGTEYRLDPVTVQVTFNTSPQGAEVKLTKAGGTGASLGQTGQPLPVNLASLAGGSEKAGFEVTFHLAGYHDETVAGIPAGAFKPGRANAWPPDGKPYPLRPTSPLVPLRRALRDHPWAFAGGGLLLAALAALALPRLQAHRRRLERARYLEGLALRTDRDDPLIGHLVDTWRVVARLGKGGMATVYRVLPDETLDESQARALKLVDPDAFASEEYRKRFWREVEVLESLRHPSIVGLEAFGEHGGRLYLVMELVEGRPLGSRIRAGGLPPAEAGDLLVQILEGLEFAHSRGIVHRDLKPDNVMVTPAGRVKIMDFGLARGHQFSTVTLSGTALGTPAYMPPEQIQGRPFDPRADQYSLGVIAYELLTGDRPFPDDEPMALIFKHLAEAPPPLRERRPDLPEALAAVVERMLAKEPEDRFPDARAAREALQAALA